MNVMSRERVTTSLQTAFWTCCKINSQKGKSSHWEHGLCSYPIICLEFLKIPSGLIFSEFPETLFSALSCFSGPATTLLHWTRPGEGVLHVVTNPSYHVWRCPAWENHPFPALNDVSEGLHSETLSAEPVLSSGWPGILHAHGGL